MTGLLINAQVSYEAYKILKQKLLHSENLLRIAETFIDGIRDIEICVADKSKHKQFLKAFEQLMLFDMVKTKAQLPHKANQ